MEVTCSKCVNMDGVSVSCPLSVWMQGLEGWVHEGTKECMSVLCERVM